LNDLIDLDDEKIGWLLNTFRGLGRPNSGGKELAQTTKKKRSCCTTPQIERVWKNFLEKSEVEDHLEE